MQRTWYPSDDEIITGEGGGNMSGEVDMVIEVVGGQDRKIEQRWCFGWPHGKTSAPHSVFIW